MPVPCTPPNIVAKQIIDSCEASFAAHRGDCNQFVKAALGPFLVVDYFLDLDADGIVGKMRQAVEGWICSRKIVDAIAAAKAGHIVIAGMTAASLGQHHGHVAVVVGCDGQASGAVTVPVGYAGSLENPAAQLNGGRISGTFAATMVRSESLDYYFKSPDRQSAA
jgi:hypothetical protein